MKKNISPIYTIDIDEMDIYNPDHVKEVLMGIEDTLKNDRGFVHPEELEEQ